jgi:hypothetical protein
MFSETTRCTRNSDKNKIYVCLCTYNDYLDRYGNTSSCDRLGEHLPSSPAEPQAYPKFVPRPGSKAMLRDNYNVNTLSTAGEIN